jgi:hypothetical protein
MPEKKPVDQLRREHVDRLFEQVVQKLSDEERARVLSYLCGYCAADKKFAEGLDAALRGNFPELYSAIVVR